MFRSGAAVAHHYTHGFSPQVALQCESRLGVDDGMPVEYPEWAFECESTAERECECGSSSAMFRPGVLPPRARIWSGTEVPDQMAT
jgi:hypothetical protein